MHESTSLRTILLIAAVSLLFACHRADANFATFVLDWNGTNAVCSMNGEACPPARVDRICTELARLDKDMQIRIVAKPQAPASELVALLSRIQKSGLHFIVLLSPARQGAVDGYYWVPVDSAKQPIPTCIPGTVQESGFIPARAGDPFHEIGTGSPSTNATLKGDVPRASASWNEALPWWEPIATEFDQRETDIRKSPFAYMRFLRDRYPSLREHESPKAARILMLSPK